MNAADIELADQDAVAWRFRALGSHQWHATTDASHAALMLKAGLIVQSLQRGRVIEGER